MKRILMIGTGGIIASEVTASGLAPELTTEQLLAHIPAISNICQVDCLQLLSLDGGQVHVDGNVESLTYEDSAREAGGFFSRLFG